MLAAQSVLFVMIFGTSAYAYRILIIYPTPSYSHQLPKMGLTEALVKKGHQVFVLSPNAVPGLEQNYTFVDFSWIYKNRDIKQEKLTLQQLLSKWDMIPVFNTYQNAIRMMFESNTFKQFQRRVKDEGLTFDVVIVDPYLIPFGVAAARLLAGNKPVVTLATMTGANFYGEAPIGNILHPSYSPSLLSGYTDKMSLWERLDNWFTHHYFGWRLKKIIENGAKSFVRDNFGGPEAEALVENSWANVSLSIIASNALYYYPRAITPNVVEVGCLHIKTPEKLPQILQNWLDGAEHGVVYFSLGSNMKSIYLPDGALSNLLKVFGELPRGYRVLWKWEQDGQIPGQPDNILTQKWLPQQSVLAHPKVKVFITQGGCQSFQETVHYGVPTVGIPRANDQVTNVAKMMDSGIGVRLRPQELSSYQKVKSAVEAVLFEERYSKNMKTLSELTQDFTLRARDKAVFWVEHVAKHGGASHFRPQTAETSYFQFFCLDILLVFLVVSCAVLYIVVSIFRYFISTMFLSSSEKIKIS